MRKIIVDLSRYQPAKVKSKITNQRQEVMKMFVDRLNADRISGGYKPLRPAFYAVRMRFMDIQQLRQFYGYCDEAMSFSRTWWWATNPKNFDNNPPQVIESEEKSV